MDMAARISKGIATLRHMSSSPVLHVLEIIMEPSDTRLTTDVPFEDLFEPSTPEHACIEFCFSRDETVLMYYHDNLDLMPGVKSRLCRKNAGLFWRSRKVQATPEGVIGLVNELKHVFKCKIASKTLRYRACMMVTATSTLHLNSLELDKIQQNFDNREALMADAYGRALQHGSVHMSIATFFL